MNREWIEAAKILGDDPTARVACPSCKGEAIVVSDHYVAGSSVFERHLSCARCGMSSIMRKRYARPSEEAAIGRDVEAPSAAAE